MMDCIKFSFIDLKSTCCWEPSVFVDLGFRHTTYDLTACRTTTVKLVLVVL